MFRSARIVAIVVALVAVLSANRAVRAGSHLWVINEVFSNPDGSVQFIELKECCGAEEEIYLFGLQIYSYATGNYFTFNSNLQPPTSYRHLLLGTPGFAALPGAPQPDFTLPPNFFNHAGDTLDYYVYDQWAIAPGSIPTDCVNSLSRNGKTSPNTPTNYDGASHTVDACPSPKCAGDANNSQTVDIDDLVVVITSWGAAGGPGDVNKSGTVNIDDLVEVITHWGPCS